MVSGSLPPIRCGVGHYTSRLSRELAAEKLDFQLLSTEGVDRKTPAPLLTVPNWKVRTIPKMLDAIKTSRAQIVHIQYPAVGYRRQLGINLLPYVIKLLRPRLKLVITLHEYHQSRWIGKLRNLITILPAHKVLVSNQLDKSGLARWVGYKVRIVPIGANFEVAKPNQQFYEKTLKDLGLAVSKPTLVFFGYAFPSKRLEVLLDALNEPQLLNYQLLLVASFDKDEPYQKMLKAKINKLNQNEIRAGVTGFLEGDDVSAILQASRYFVLPNVRPISAKSGTAIAATVNGMILLSHGSNRPIETTPFEHLKNSYLLERVTPQSIAAAIEHLEDSPADSRKILAGVKELQKYFSWTNIVKQHTKLYEEL